jgi:hypothetical protein
MLHLLVRHVLSMRVEVVELRPGYHRNINFEKRLFQRVWFPNEASIHFSYLGLGLFVCSLETGLGEKVMA